MTDAIETLTDQIDAMVRMGMAGTLKHKDMLKRLDQAKREAEKSAEPLTLADVVARHCG